MDWAVMIQTARRSTVMGTVALAGLSGSLEAQQISAEGIVEACAEAMGGRERIDALRTLRFLYTLPDHGGSQQRTEIMRPNRIRLGDDLVFDGERVARLNTGRDAEGNPRPPELVDPEEWKDWEVDIGRYFPAFFEYPSEYQGIEFVAGIESHKLSVLLPMGGRSTYWIEVATNLPFMEEHVVTMHGNRFRGQRMYGGYREVDGVMIPFEFSYYSPHMRRMLYLEMDAVEVDVPLEERHFKIPEGVGG